MGVFRQSIVIRRIAARAAEQKPMTVEIVQFIWFWGSEDKTVV
jgi:hypothetical protein